MEEKIKAIYYIKDLRNDKIIYIGQTNNFKDRKHRHFGHKETPIDKYMFEEGRNNFIMEMFDIDCTNMSDDEILQKEGELILYYDTINTGINKRRSGLISKNRNIYRKKYLDEWNKEYHKKYYQLHKEEIKEKSKEYSRQYRARKKQQKSDAQTTL